MNIWIYSFWGCLSHTTEARVSLHVAAKLGLLCTGTEQCSSSAHRGFRRPSRRPLAACPGWGWEGTRAWLPPSPRGTGAEQLNAQILTPHPAVLLSGLQMPPGPRPPAPHCPSTVTSPVCMCSPGLQGPSAPAVGGAEPQKGLSPRLWSLSLKSQVEVWAEPSLLSPASGAAVLAVLGIPMCSLACRSSLQGPSHPSPPQCLCLLAARGIRSTVPSEHLPLLLPGSTSSGGGLASCSSLTCRTPAVKGALRRACPLWVPP